MSDYQMSLFHVITNWFTLYDAYSCPGNETLKVFKRPLLGGYFLASGVVLITLYIPCFVVMLKSKSPRPPIFHIMMVLAVFDMISLFVNSVTTGVFDLLGVTFCHFPLFIYITGSIGTGSWMGGCAACILLAVDRCVESNAKFCLAFLFHKWKFRIVMVIVLSYWAYSCLFTKPLLFTAEFSSWFFDPKIGNDPAIYHSVAHTMNNLVVSATTTLLYIYLCVHLAVKNTYTSSMWACRSKNQIILQAVILCSFHAAAAYIYVYMQFFYSPPALILLGQLSWQWSNGCFCVVYLTLNRTIRNSVLQILLSKKFRETHGLYLAPDEKTGTFACSFVDLQDEVVDSERNIRNAVAVSGCSNGPWSTL
uniref:Uncharacterized protein n=2 Tax=Caenorhabditis japonica TaxID=281687 RepID=A0A8R1E6W5_CAEJA